MRWRRIYGNGKRKNRQHLLFKFLRTCYIPNFTTGWWHGETRKRPGYTVIQQKAILGISNLLPTDKAMLVRIPYFGKKGVEKYGDIILEMVYGYRKEKGLAEPELML
mgnify:CR=1 FL=1